MRQNRDQLVLEPNRSQEEQKSQSTENQALWK
jgi:hypothetical protein